MNHIENSQCIDQKTIKIPASKNIDISLLLQSTSISSIGDSEFKFNFLLNYNNDLIIEHNKFIINIKEVFGLNGTQSAEILSQLEDWNKEHSKGIVLSGKTKWMLSNGIKRHSNSSFITNEKYEKFKEYLENNNIEKMLNTKYQSPIVPDFLVENKSVAKGENNKKKYCKSKMISWINAGVESAILIDGKNRCHYYFCATPKIVGEAPLIEGSEPIRNEKGILVGVNCLQVYWPNPPDENKRYGPSIKIPCYGVMSGFNIDISKYSLSEHRY
eukprot:gene7608-9357_t